MTKEISLSEPAWDYMKQIYKLEHEHSPVSTSALAEALGLAPSSVTEMLKRLARQGFINYTPYRGITLTEKGASIAIKGIRRHRIVERFLTDMLGFEWHEAHQEAVRFENELSEEVERRLFVALHKPSECPHGYPIPGKAQPAFVEEHTLYELEPGETALVLHVRDDEPELLQFMASLGIKPGVKIKIVEKDPFKGPVGVTIAGRKRTIGWHLANSIYVSRENDKAAS
jgi:DtxR family Mn-dependent transcriptional regulator